MVLLSWLSAHSFKKLVCYIFSVAQCTRIRTKITVCTHKLLLNLFVRIKTIVVNYDN